MVLGSGNHWFRWFSMVVHHWSNDGMVTYHRRSLICGWVGKTFWQSQETDLSKQKIPFSQTNVSLSILVDFRPFSGNGPGERNCRNKICRKLNSQNGPIQQEFCLLNFSIGLNFFILFLTFCLKFWMILDFFLPI